MEKPGSRNMYSGLIWAVAGVLLTALTFELFEWEGGVLFYGAVIVGVIQSIVGVFQRLQYATLSPERKQEVHAEAGLVTLIRCMAMVANADGTLGAAELSTIQTVLQRITGATMDEDRIREIVKKVGTGGEDPAEFVAGMGLQAAPELRPVIAKACYLVMVSDGDMSKKEVEMLGMILSALCLPANMFSTPVARGASA